MKKLISHMIRIFPLLVLLFGNISQAQNTFLITVENLTQTASNKLEWDVYLLNTDVGSFELVNFQLGFTYNAAIYAGGTISAAIDNTNCGLSNTAQWLTATPNTGTPGVIKEAGKSPPGAGNGSIISQVSPGTLLTHFILTSSIPFVAGTTPNLAFSSSNAVSPLYPTKVAQYVASVGVPLVVTSGVNALVRTSWLGNFSTNWSDATNWSNGLVPTSSEDIFISSIPTNQPHVTSVPGSPAECHNVKILSGATLTVDAGKALTAYGSTTNNGTLLIKSDATGIGSFIDNGTITGSGTYNVQRWVSTNGSSRWEYVSSPVAAASSNLFTSTHPRGLYYANEPTNSYLSYSVASPGTMEIMRGYTRKFVLAEADGDAVKTFSGPLNTGAQSINLTGTTISTVFNGWNLVGNPYTSSMDWDAGSGWTKTNLDDAVYFRSNGNYSSWVAGASSNGATSYIPPMQAFWVRVSSGFTTGSLACNNNVRLHNAHYTYKTTPSTDNNLRITVVNNANTLTDDTYLRFGAYATDAFDGAYDAYKMFASDSTYPQVYTNDGVDVSINSLSDLIGERDVPLGFKTSIAGQFTITAAMVSNFTNAGNTVYLEDIQTGIYQDLSANNTYTFTSGVTTGLSRFILHFNPTFTGISAIKNDNLNLYGYGNQIYYSSSETLQGQIDVYDMLGKLLATTIVSGVTSGTLTLNAVCAMYVVKFTDNQKTISKRVFVN